jgi:D-glycero-D-manno-heptose 1,7-bisphosphate phosphatase
MVDNFKRALFLDRDGVVIQTNVSRGKPYANHDLKTLRFLPGIKELICFAIQSKFLPILITNQPDVARGKVGIAIVEELNNRILEETGIVKVYMCIHDDNDNCTCRKPLPGLFLQARNELKIDLESSFMIGDRWKDVRAAQSAGVRAIHIDSGYSEEMPCGDFIQVKTLEEAIFSIKKEF